ncbi:MAG: LLM class flavin-dependent oxidoreductase [Anaerolineales bacterium]|jgi:alkanesulfonate monooxygenase SsuD/methylene tetrahydromethanopterin reductase-like flavin-dependent oxidoreductase (luciferase family)
MKYGVEIVPFGTYADPRKIVQVAHAAEAAGWDGIFLWDHLAFTWGVPAADPWVSLSAVAQATNRLRLGVNITPLPRRRPQILATTLAGLDLLSAGRVTFGTGLGGVPLEFTAFGEREDAGTRAAMLDEGLVVLDGLLRGQEVQHQGRFYTVNGVCLSPLPLQKPRPPIWIGGESKPALRRAAKWDGWVVSSVNEAAKMIKTPEEMAASWAYIRSFRDQITGFDITMSGVSEPGDDDLTRAYAQAGVTWWLESIFDLRGSMEKMLERIYAGPARCE